MKNHQILFFSVLALLITGIVITFGLIRGEIIDGGVCPKLFGIPACFVVMALLLTATLSHLWDFWFRDVAFFVVAGLGALIAIWFTVSNVAGWSVCPEMWGIPLCYLSLLMFGSLIGLRYWMVRL